MRGSSEQWRLCTWTGQRLLLGCALIASVNYFCFRSETPFGQADSTAVWLHTVGCYSLHYTISACEAAYVLQCADAVAHNTLEYELANTVHLQMAKVRSAAARTVC